MVGTYGTGHRQEFESRAERSNKVEVSYFDSGYVRTRLLIRPTDLATRFPKLVDYVNKVGANWDRYTAPLADRREFREFGIPKLRFWHNRVRDKAERIPLDPDNVTTAKEEIVVSNLNSEDRAAIVQRDPSRLTVTTPCHPDGDQLNRTGFKVILASNPTDDDECLADVFAVWSREGNGRRGEDGPEVLEDGNLEEVDVDEARGFIVEVERQLREQHRKLFDKLSQRSLKQLGQEFPERKHWPLLALCGIVTLDPKEGGLKS